MGFNYRMSNLLAALGRAQLPSLDPTRRTPSSVNRRYRDALGDPPGVAFMPDVGHGEPINWLTVVTDRTRGLRRAPRGARGSLEAHDIEARPAWKPLHLQPLFADTRSWAEPWPRPSSTRGLCLPSGTSLPDADVDRIIGLIRSATRA